VENVMLKKILWHKSTSDGGALANMCGRDEELWLSMVTPQRIAMANAHYMASNTCCL
jgi:hypothetical protein